MKSQTPAALFGPLPELRKMSHAADPATSKEAARKHVESGNCATNCDIVLGLVRRFANSTAIEMWEFASDAERERLKEGQEVRRRLTDLVAAGKVKATGERKCRFRGSVCQIFIERI